MTDKPSSNKSNSPSKQSQNTLRGLDIKLSLKGIHFQAETMPISAFWGLLGFLVVLLVIALCFHFL